MLTVFEVVIARGQDPEGMLSAETLAETEAQVMTLAEAGELGFSGMRPDEKGREIRLVAVAPRDSQFIQRRLEASAVVQSFRVHEVEM